jgi:hypothetical protein
MRTTPAGAKEKLPGLLPLDLVIQDEARSAARRLWSLGCRSYLQICRGHSMLMRLQRSDAIFNMGVHIIRPAFNLEPKYRVTMLMREEWTRGPGTLSVVKGLVWFTNGSRMKDGTWAGVYGQSLGRRHGISLRKYATVFRLRCILSWRVYMQLKRLLGQRNMLVYAMRVRRL